MAFGQSTDTPKKPAPADNDAVKRLQEYAKKKAQQDEEEKKKKKNGVDTGPTPGIFQRLYDFYQGTKKKDQPKPPENITGVRG